MGMTRLFAFAGGGTGGHLFPAIAVADEILRIRADCEVLFFCTSRPFDAEQLSERGFPFVVQPVRSWPSNPFAWPGFLAAWRQSCRLVRSHWRQRRPAGVLGSGGFGAGPAVRVAASLGVPTALLNPDAVPGRANRYLARRAEVVFCQWRVTSRSLPRPDQAEVTGCPIRRAFRDALRQQGVARFDLDAAKRTLVVTGASQGAHSLNLAIRALLPQLATLPQWQVVHLSGMSDAQTMSEAYRTGGACGRVIAFTDEMASLLAAADLVVSRAGASTLAELTALGKPSVLLPYPFHRDRHQWANARQLADVGAALICEDRVRPEENAAALGRVLLPLMRDPERLASMSRAARALGRPDAGEIVARRLLDLAERASHDAGRSTVSLKRISPAGR